MHHSESLPVSTWTVFELQKNPFEISYSSLLRLPGAAAAVAIQSFSNKESFISIVCIAFVRMFSSSRAHITLALLSLAASISSLVHSVCMSADETCKVSMYIEQQQQRKENWKFHLAFVLAWTLKSGHFFSRMTSQIENQMYCISFSIWNIFLWNVFAFKIR